MPQPQEQHGALPVRRPLNTLVGAKEVLAGTATEISGVKVVDPSTLALTFVTPNALFPTAISELFILQKKQLEAVKPEEMKKSPIWGTDPIGTGPFMWDKYTPGQSIELVPFPNYWRGAPKLDRLIRREFQDPSAALLAFDNGEVDFTYLTADEVEREKWNTNAVVLPGGSGVDNEIFLNNVKHPELANVKFKQALITAIDRQAIIDNLYGGGGTIVPCLYSRPNLTAGVDPQPFDAAAAQQLLKDSGVDISKVQGWDLKTYYKDALLANVMTAILKNWQTCSASRAARSSSSMTWRTQQAAKTGDYDWMFVGAANGPTGDRAFNYLHSSALYPAGGNGRQGPGTRTPRSTRCSRMPAPSSTRPSRMRSTSRPARSCMTTFRTAVPVGDRALPRRSAKLRT